jgi:caspase 7
MATTKVVKIYDMNHEKRGIALVINISEYDPTPTNEEKQKERVWSKKDVKNLKQTLEYLEFDLKMEENLTKSELENVLKEQAEKSHENYDCFLCVVMSHGIDDHIVTRDNQLISFADIMAPIKSCKTLIGKPKLFFFQACRGKNELESILRDQLPPISQSRTSSASSVKSSQIARMSDSTNLQNKKFSELPPIQSEYESDLLVYFSTLPGHLSWSNNDPKEGTIFIKSVCDVFNDAYKNIPDNLSLAQMVNRINNELSSKEVEINDENRHKVIVQVAERSNTMKGDVYFWPKNVNVIFFFT